jgi:alkylhydroperoxidase/carboxymuconolactone decarboxylase family protein YurZ
MAENKIVNALILLRRARGGKTMNIRKKILDYEYEEVLDTKTRELIRVGCAIAVGCPT